MIRIIGPINEESFKTFSEELAEHEFDVKSKAKFTTAKVELASTGGSAYDALAFAARIRNSPCDIIIRAYGLVASAAVIILAAGDTREMASEAWVMVHEDSDKPRGNVTLLETEVSQLRRLETQWAQELARYCNNKTTVEQWSKLHKQTTYLSATECLERGLVDKII